MHSRHVHDTCEFFRNVLSFVLFVRSQPIMMCRQCPGYKADVSQLLFATGSNYWFPGLPAPAPVPPPPKPAATEGCAKATGEQPSTSSDGPSGDAEYLHLKFSHIHCWNSKNGSHTVIKSLSILTLQICLFAPSLRQLPKSIAAPLGASTSSAPAASSRCQTDGPSSAARRLPSNVSGT